jgi:hypothetical protein
MGRIWREEDNTNVVSPGLLHDRETHVSTQVVHDEDLHLILRDPSVVKVFQKNFLKPGLTFSHVKPPSLICGPHTALGPSNRPSVIEVPAG